MYLFSYFVGNVKENFEEKEDESFYRRLSVEESVLLYRGKALGVPRYPETSRCQWYFSHLSPRHPATSHHTGCFLATLVALHFTLVSE